MGKFEEFMEEDRKREQSHRAFGAFVGPFLLAGGVLVARYLLSGFVPLLMSETLATLFPFGLTGYLVSDDRWWLTFAVMTFAGISGLLLDRGREYWALHREWKNGWVIESAVGFVAFGAAAVFGVVRYF